MWCWSFLVGEDLRCFQSIRMRVDRVISTNGCSVLRVVLVVNLPPTIASSSVSSNIFEKRVCPVPFQLFVTISSSRLAKKLQNHVSVEFVGVSKIYDFLSEVVQTTSHLHNSFLIIIVSWQNPTFSSCHH